MKVKWRCISLIKSWRTNGIDPSLPTHLRIFPQTPPPSPPPFKSSPEPERNTPEAGVATKDKNSSDKNLFLAIPVHAM